MKLTLIVAVLSRLALGIGLSWVAYLLSQTLLLVGDHWILALAAVLE